MGFSLLILRKTNWAYAKKTFLRVAFKFAEHFILLVPLYVDVEMVRRHVSGVTRG